MCADEHDDKVLKSNGGKNYELSKNRNDNNVYYKTVSSDKPVTSLPMLGTHCPAVKLSILI